MNHNQTYRFWRAVAQYLSGSIALAVLTFVCFRLQLNLATTAFLYLIIIVLLCLQGSFLLSAVFSLIAMRCLAYYFAPPIFLFLGKRSVRWRGRRGFFDNLSSYHLLGVQSAQVGGRTTGK